MKRSIDSVLLAWKEDALRKPLLLRGARQVGKTYAVRELGKTFERFVEINFEFDTEIAFIFGKNLDPHRIIQEISLLKKTQIIPGKTLLFFDEIQVTPAAVLALRYFYEMLPELHIIAAGSLLDFALEHVGLPVGRVSSFYMYPLSFSEFLQATDNELLMAEIYKNSFDFSDTIHKRLLELVGEYCAIGGMPEAVRLWATTRDALGCFLIHQSLITTYRNDFEKYATKLQIKYVNILFDSIPRQLSNKFVYSNISQDYRARDLAPALDLLVTAGVVHKVYKTAGNGIPLGAEMDLKDFKIIFMDIALAQSILGVDLAAWIINPLAEFVNKGSLLEAFIGQELLAYLSPLKKQQLFYWRKEESSSTAELDYLIARGTQVIPIEVKAGKGTALKSMHVFLEKHQQSPYGIRFSSNTYSCFEKIYSYPLYAVDTALKFL